jgi:hypothetical protein
MSLLLNLGNSITAGSDPYQFYNFRERVLTDGATVLSDTQVSDEIKRLRSLGLYSKFSALYTPAVRNTSKLYSIISADGDATVTRGSVKNINSATGTLEEIASNVTPSSFGTGGWGALVEGARTNNVIWSEDFTQTAWNKTISATVTGNTGIAPDGTTTADTFTAGANGSQIQQSFVGLSGTTYTVSFYIRRITGTGVVNLRAVENVNTPITITSSWARYSLAVVSTTTTIRIGLTLGTSGDEIEIWGAQLEAGSFASSYMKTEGATFTRSADVITKTGASDLIGQTEGTLFAVVDYRNLIAFARQILYLSDNSDLNRVFLTTVENVSRVRFEVRNTTNQASITTGDINSSGILKIAGVYKENDFRLYVNGALIGSDTSGTVPVMNRINVGCKQDGTQSLFDRILLAGISKTALTQAEAIALTT